MPVVPASIARTAVMLAASGAWYGKGKRQDEGRPRNAAVAVVAERVGSLRFTPAFVSQRAPEQRGKSDHIGRGLTLPDCSSLSKLRVQRARTVFLGSASGTH